MKIQVASDLHLEFLRASLRAGLSMEALIATTDADVIVLAGDIHKGVEAVEFAGELAHERGVPVILVPGNHEYYGGDVRETLAAMRRAGGKNVHLLACDAVIINGVRFLGATMWTDFELYPEISPDEALGEAQRGLNDFRVIQMAGRRFTAEDSRDLHLLERTWLERQLTEHWIGATVVVTHHAPAPESIQEPYRGQRLTPAFAADLRTLMTRFHPALWVHGHTHSPCDYVVGKTRVLSNQCGYPREWTQAPGAGMAGYRNDCLVTLSDEHRSRGRGDVWDDC